MNGFALDIETLGTPERSGYGIVIPNYAIVKIPDTLTHELEWLYVQLPIQDQLDKGLKTDAKTMDFWFNVCAQEFPLALCEMQKSFTLSNANVIRYDNSKYSSETKITDIIKFFMHNSDKVDNNIKIYGNGCHFDCSILQENHRIMFDDANLWHYSAPNNVRTLRLLLSKEEEEQMKDAVQPYLNAFCDDVNDKEIMFDLCLHNPLFDAAKEALFISYILNLKKSY